MPELTSLDELTATPHAAVFETERPRTVRLRLPAGERLPEHSHPETDVVFHLVEGRLELTLDGEASELESGDLARFGGDCDISPRAIEASTAVIVFAPEESA